MKKILIGSNNPYKQKRLSEIVKDYFIPIVLSDLPSMDEVGTTFLEIAQNKAIFYSKFIKGLAISTDGGAVIPVLKEWDPIKTRRFGKNDKERIKKLLALMEGVVDRKIEWYEALAVAEKGKLLFSIQAKAMDGVIDRFFNQKFYQEGIWLCSITSFPQLGNRNYFELNDKERKVTEDSWQKLKDSFADFMKSTK